MVAALVGLLLDPDYFDPTFPLPRERPEDALARERPPLVLVLDCDLDAARSDLFYARMAKTRATVVLFGAPSGHEDVAELARLRSVPCIQLPTNREALTAAIRAAITNAMHAGMWGIAAAILIGACGVPGLGL